MSKPENPILVYSDTCQHGVGPFSDITLRDLFAGMALQPMMQLILHPESRRLDGSNAPIDDEMIARNVYGFADAMLAERAKWEGE